MKSNEVEAFLNFLRESEQNLHIAEMAEKEANEATQDILHKIELGELKPYEMVLLTKKLREIRQQRREAKDTRIQCEPIVCWASNNHTAIKSIERLLGDVRKAEKVTQNRIYIPKTDVLGGQTI